MLKHKMQLENILFVLLMVCLSDAEGDTSPTKPLVDVSTPQIDDLITAKQFPSAQNTPVRILNSFFGLTPGVKSEPVQVLDKKTLLIPNFHFDGNTPDVHFVIGKGAQISQDGIRLTPENLLAYNGQDVVLELPSNSTSTIDEFDWLALWCGIHQQNLGFVPIKKRLPSYPPQTFGFADEVTSGPIVLVDKKTLFLPNFRYAGNHENTHFCAGNFTETPETPVLISDENGLGIAHSYYGENIYVGLPEGISTDNVDYFGVWAGDEGRSLGHVLLGNISNIPEVQPRTDNLTIMRVPKCCPFFNIITSGGCQEQIDVEFRPHFHIFEHNTTHLNNVSLDLKLFRFEPYVFSLPCSFKYALEEEVEDFALLQNGSLIVRGVAVVGVLSQGDFCMDTIPDNFAMKVFVCAPEVKINQAMYRAYLTLVIISTLCFAGAVILFKFILKYDDTHRTCFIWYSLWMCITFFFLIIVQVAYIEDTGCEVVGYFFQYSIMSSFIWLAVLCFDIMFIVIYFEDNEGRGKRLRYYLGAAIGFPLLLLIISLARNSPDVPDSFFKPQYQRNTCHFESELQGYFFYLPMGALIVCCAVCLGWTQWKIWQNDKHNEYNYYWMGNYSRNYKFMFRRYLLIFVTMFLWFLEVWIRVKYGNSSILMGIEIIEAAQGITVLLLFVVNKDSKLQIMERVRRLRRQQVAKRNEEEIMLKTIPPS